MTVTISSISSTKPASSIRSFTRTLKSRRAMPSSSRMRMWPPSRTGIGQQVQEPEVEADLRHQAEQRDDPALGRLA